MQMDIYDPQWIEIDKIKPNEGDYILVAFVLTTCDYDAKTLKGGEPYKKYFEEVLAQYKEDGQYELICSQEDNPFLLIHTDFIPTEKWENNKLSGLERIDKKTITSWEIEIKAWFPTPDAYFENEEE